MKKWVYLFLVLFPVITFAQKSAIITNVYATHDKKGTSYGGFTVHVYFDIKGMKGYSGRVLCFFKENGSIRKTNTGDYIYLSQNYTPLYDNSTYKDVQLSIVGSSLGLTDGQHVITCFIDIRDDYNNSLAQSEECIIICSVANAPESGSYCSSCMGTNRCRFCNGRGNYGGSGYYSAPRICPSCRGGGICPVCKGNPWARYIFMSSSPGDSSPNTLPTPNYGGQPYSGYGPTESTDDVCRRCYGSGTCDNCGGKGTVYRDSGLSMKEVKCPICAPYYGFCPSCRGSRKSSIR